MKALREEFCCGRLVIPHGDRRDRSESRGAKGEEMVVLKRHHDIVSVLVLRDDLYHGTRRRLLTSPVEHIRQRLLLPEFCLGANEHGWRNGPDA